MATYSDVESAVQQILGRSDSSTNTKILNACNQVMKLMAASGNWEDMEQVNESLTLTTDTYKYVLRTWLSDTLFTKVLNIQVYDNSKWQKPLQQVTPIRFDKEYAPNQATTTNRPTTFMIWKRTLHLYPTPDEDYTVKVRYYTKPTALTAAGSTIEFDDLYLPAITHATAGFVWVALEELDLAKTFMKMADGFFGEFLAFNDRMFNFASFVSAKHNEPVAVSEAWANPFVNQIGG